MKSRNALIVLVVALAGLLVWLAFVWQPQAPAASAAPPTLAPAQASGGDFVLRGPQGPVALADYRGRVVVLYFGYTFCPDVCPTSLAIIGQALSALEPAEVAQVAGILVSLDPGRDTPEVLEAYAPFFHPNIVGVTGSAEQIAEVARQYGARYMKQKPDSDGLYAVDHSSVTYIVDRQGKLAASLAHGTSPQHLADALRRVMGSARKD